MTTLYSSNFDAATVGSIAPGWANLNGSWTVQATQPVSGGRTVQRSFEIRIVR